jgi:hypothetical protein
MFVFVVIEIAFVAIALCVSLQKCVALLTAKLLLTQFGTAYNPLSRKQRQKSWVNSLHEPPVSVILIIKTHTSLAEPVGPFQFLPAKPVAYEGSFCDGHCSVAFREIFACLRTNF